MVDVPIAAPEVGDAEQTAVQEVLESGHLAAGDVVDGFEREFADYCGADHGIATSNGTTALHAAFEAVGVKPGDEVITTPFSFVATGNAIRFAGGVPVFADVDPETYNLDPASVEAKLQEHGDAIAAIAPVYLFGLPAEMDALRELADRYDVSLVADAAQAHGGRYKGEPVGSIADVATFSFYPTKNMTCGEGGMVTTDNPEIAAGVRQFIDHGRAEDGYTHEELGHNFRMTDIAAAIGHGQLRRLPEYVTARQDNAARLTDALEAADAPVTTPVTPADRTHAFNQYTVRCENRDRLAEALESQAIGSKVYYPRTIPDQPAYDAVSAEVPVARQLTDEVLSLPVHPTVDDTDIDRIAEAVTEVGVHVSQ